MNLFLKLCLTISLVIISQQSIAQEAARSAKLYKEPTMLNLSQTYWRLNKFDIEDDVAVDNFMLINECDLYSEFIKNEFEWRNIQAASRAFLKTNNAKFPLRYTFNQALSLGSYDFERKGFNIAENSQINGIRIFEMPSNDIYTKICGVEKKISGYPRAVLLELSRPLELNFIPFDEDAAKRLIAKRMDPYKQMNVEDRKYLNVDELRDVMIIMNVRLFSYKAPDQKTDDMFLAANILGVLEEIYIYTDQSKQELMFYKNYRKKDENRIQQRKMFIEEELNAKQ